MGPPATADLYLHIVRVLVQGAWVTVEVAVGSLAFSIAFALMLTGGRAYAGRFVSAVQRTFWLWLVFWLHVLAVIAAALMYWFTQRGESRPLPKFELVY